MKTKVLQVFYNENGLPFKDQERTVHFPVIGSGFMGASNTTQIKFYFKEIGDDAVKYVAVSKLPNGKVGSKVLENYYDSELDEPYALLELDSYYTQYKGDLFISLQGYQGGVQVNYDEDTELYEIEGTPTIQATGSIKFTNNYATQFVGSGEEQNITLQQLLAIISDTVLRYYVNSSNTLAEVFNEIGTKICAVDIEGDEYLVEMSGDTNIVIYDIHNQEWYAFTGANTTTIDEVMSSDNKQIIATKEDLENFGNLFTYKGTASVSEINALTDIGNGWCYNLTDSGTLTLGNLSVETGDNVAFNGTIWTKLSSETVLGNYYTKQEGQEFEQEVNEQISAIGNQVQQVASGSPKGVYATLNELETAYPTGADGIYVVQANAHWYYWNGSAWTDGGTYFATNNLIYGDRSFINVNQIVAPYNDLNTLPLGSIVTYIVAINSSSVANLPTSLINGTVMTFDYSNTEVVGVQCQLFFENDGTIYYRNKFGANWRSWKQLALYSDISTLITSALSDYSPKSQTDKALYGVNIWGSIQSAPYNDCNTFPANEIVSYAAGADSLLNKPSVTETSCTVITLAYAKGNSALMRTQLYIVDGKMFFRTFYATSWSSWTAIPNSTDISNAISSALNTALADYSPKSVTDLDMRGKALWTSVQAAPYDDYDTFPSNEIISYAAGADDVAHAPNNSDDCICMTFAYTKGTPIMRAQLCITDRGDKTWFRGFYLASGWSSWKSIPTIQEVIDALSTDEGIKALMTQGIVEAEPYSMSMFEKIAVIGDSFASGLIVNPPDYTINVNKYNLSWIQIMARHFGITATNYSQNGWTIKDFLTNTNEHSLAQLLQDTPKDLYYICMAINEDKSAAAVGTIADITNDYTQNPDTFYGNMARAIEQIQAHSPNGKIILCTAPGSVDTSVDIAIREIATHYGIGYIHTYDDPYFASSYYNDFKTNHPTVVGYSGYAMAYARLTYQAIKNNVNYFLFFVGNN